MLATENLWRAWSFQPLVLGGAIVAIAFFVHGWLRLRRRRAALAPWSRLPLFVAGVLVTVLAIVSPVDHIGETYLQSVHMLQHVLIADLGVVLILLAVRGPLDRVLPATRPAGAARPDRARCALRSASCSARGSATPSGSTVLVGVARPAALRGGAASHRLVARPRARRASCSAACSSGRQIIDPSRHHRLTLGERLGYAALVFWTGQILAYVVVFSFEPLYSTLCRPARAAARPLALSPTSGWRAS